jgi:hypothetical protein
MLGSNHHSRAEHRNKFSERVSLVEGFCRHSRMSRTESYTLSPRRNAARVLLQGASQPLKEKDQQ